jgi:hypothetical protein
MDCLKPYENTIFMNKPISEDDKKTLKHNTRKHALFEQAYVFCNDLFNLSKNNENTTVMTPQQILNFTSSILSIVLSHHFQKEDIKKMIEGTSVDFQLVRDSMYKYSKKAEERLFTNPCFAYFFVQFATSQ